MSRSTYAPKESYLGTGSLSAYTFDFKIEALAQLLVIEVDDTGVETQRVLGTDVTYLSSVDYDPINGAGTVNLAANLTTDYTLIILLANDAPTQPYEFRNKGSFTLKRIESALDFLAGAIQRLTYRGKQALRIHDLDDEETFNSQFPPDIVAAAAKYIKVNDAGDGFEYGFTLLELQTAILPPGTIAGQTLTWTGVAWAARQYGGGLVVTSTQDIGAAGQITFNAAIQQILKVQGLAGPQTANIAPFAAPPANGTVVTLLGMSNVNVLKIPYSDTAEGCMLKGDAYLGLNDTLTLVYDSALQRYLELSRN